MAVFVCKAPLLLALSATALALVLFWAYLAILAVTRRYESRVQNILFRAALNSLLAAIVTSVVFTVAVSVLRMMA